MATAIRSKHERDLTTGPIFKNLITFAIPLVLTNLLQLIFNATDIAVLRALVNERAVASVGTTTSIINLLVNFFIGLSVGASVVLSRCVGSADSKKAKKVVGTAISLSLITGVFLMIVGYFGARTFLIWMDCPPTLLEGATKYLQIYFLGMPIILFYNFSAGLLRAVGDSMRPMIYLMVAGVANVGLNIFFILVFNMTVEGVAIGTVASQGIAGILALLAMLKSDGYAKFSFKQLKVSKQELKDILLIGLPTGLQSTMFSISNVIIQSTVNTFGEFAVAGNTASSQIDGMIGISGNSIAHACMSFVSQNYGAKNVKRIKKVIFLSIFVVLAMQSFLGMVAFLFAKPLCSIFAQTEGALEFAAVRLRLMCCSFGLCGCMEIVSYALRAVGKSITSMLISLFFVCVFRVIWIKTFYLSNPTFLMIFISYPVSWLLCLIVDIIVIARVMSKLRASFERDKNLKVAE